jgi:hypothetical protein
MNAENKQWFPAKRAGNGCRERFSQDVSDSKRSDLRSGGELSPGVTDLSFPEICLADEPVSHQKGEQPPLRAIAEADRTSLPLHLDHHPEEATPWDDTVWLKGIVSANEKILGTDFYYPMENEPLCSRRSEGDHISQADRH